LKTFGVIDEARLLADTGSGSTLRREDRVWSRVNTYSFSIQVSRSLLSRWTRRPRRTTG